MVRPGVTTRKPRVKCLLEGWRTALTVCQDDQHGHDGCLTGPGGQLQREAHQFGIGVLVGSGQVVEQSFAALEVRCDFGQPNRGFDGFHLTKEWADAAKRVVPPMLEQACRFRADLPLGRVGQGPPRIHVLAHFIDDGGRIVLLFLGGESLPLVKHHLGLLPGLFPLLWLRNRRDELGAATPVQDLLSRLSLGSPAPSVAVGTRRASSG